LVEDGGVSVEQRRVDDVRVAHHPADVAGGPVRLAGTRVEDVGHAPLQRHRVPAVVAHDALGAAGGAAGVEDVEGVLRLDGDAGGGLRALQGLVPGQVAARIELGGKLRSLQDHAAVRLVAGELERLVDHRLVGDGAARLQAAAGADQQLGPRVVDARGELVRGESAEDY